MNYIVRDPFESTTHTLFRSTGVNGVYGRTALFEKVIEGLTGLISTHRERNTEVLRFPPVINRAHIEKAGYLHSFPNLLGAVSCLSGDEMEIRRAVDRPAKDGGWAAARAHRLGADAGGLLPHLSPGRRTRPHSDKRPPLRCRVRLFPP